MSLQVKMSWVEQFMNWYPSNTRLYRRRSKTDSASLIANMKSEFDELKPFFMGMADTIWHKAKREERENRMLLARAILDCRTIGEAHAMAGQSLEEAMQVEP